MPHQPRRRGLGSRKRSRRSLSRPLERKWCAFSFVPPRWGAGICRRFRRIPRVCRSACDDLSPSAARPAPQRDAQSCMIRLVRGGRAEDRRAESQQWGPSLEVISCRLPGHIPQLVSLMPHAVRDAICLRLSGWCTPFLVDRCAAIGRCRGDHCNQLAWQGAQGRRMDRILGQSRQACVAPPPDRRLVGPSVMANWGRPHLCNVGASRSSPGQSARSSRPVLSASVEGSPLVCCLSAQAPHLLSAYRRPTLCCWCIPCVAASSFTESSVGASVIIACALRGYCFVTDSHSALSVVFGALFG